MLNEMETIDNAIPGTLTGAHTDSSRENYASSEVIKTSKDNENQNFTGEEASDKEAEVQMVMDEPEEGDRESVIINELKNKIIEVDEDSNNEVLMVEEALSIVSGSQRTSNTKATEFVIVNDGNVSLIGANSDKEIVNRYPTEDILVKDELGETNNADMSTNDVLENDPMDLLEINNRSESTSTTRSQGYVEDYGDDMSTSSAQTGSSSTSSVLHWIKEYPWLLYEHSDDPNGYCLYCNTKINIKSQKTVKQHGLSLYHRERRENYLAFREEEEKKGLSTDLVEIKQEFGTDSCVQALKLKRKSQSEAFNNFNWRRWLKDYPWLERDSAEGTTGYCKLCLVHLNVEFSYLRDRHQESGKHKDAEKQHEQNRQLKLSNEKLNEASDDNNQSKNDKWLEMVETEPHSSQIVQCKLCKTKMIKNNFLRHLRTNLHLNNVKIYQEKQTSDQNISEDGEVSKNQYNWKIYTKQHPWLISDPIDPKYAYCKYCEKRIIYGSSATKRSLHENSSQHKYNENEFKSGKRKGISNKEINLKKSKKECEIREDDEEQQSVNEDEVEEDENDEDKSEVTTEEEGKDYEEEEVTEKEVEDEEQEQDDEEYSEEDSKKEKNGDSEDENDSKKRIYRLTEEWLNQYEWCAKYNKDPTNFFFCIYCKIPLRAASSRPKHQTTAMHIAAEEEYLKRKEKKQKSSEKKQNIVNDDQNFEWSIPLKGNINMYSCKYCRVRISKHYSKKSHAASRIHQINERIYKTNRRKSSIQEENYPGQAVSQPRNISTSKKEQTFAKVIMKVPSTMTLIKQWQKKFPWLSYKRNELRSNYGYCKICECSLYLRSLKHVFRHLRSGRHVRVTKEKKKQKMEQEHVDVSKGPKQEIKASPEQTNDASLNRTNPLSLTTSSKNNEFQKNCNYRSSITELKKRFSWIESSEKTNYGYCRFCNTDIPLKILFLRNHSNSQKHRFCVKNYRGEGQETHNTNNHAGENQNDINRKCDDNDDDDVMVVEEDNEEILISEQDENWTVKSETMDEHEELDFLLQRSLDSSQNKTNAQRNIRKSVGNVEHPLPKRVKRSQSFRRLNENNTSLVASLLTTPLTLASCLGPLIQQQIQQANSQQTLLANTSTPTATVLQTQSENTFDLFFKSVSETMKKLPVDLAAEGKVRVMQIICDLELQALKRQQAANDTSGVSYQAASTSVNTQLECNSNNSSSSTNVDISAADHNLVGNDTIITQVNIDTDVPPSAASATQACNANPSTLATLSQGVDKLHSTTSTSPMVGVMDRNGMQTIQLKTSVAMQIPKSTSNTSVNTMANTGIRCIPFKNLSQPIAPDQSNSKIKRIQVPLNVTSPSVTTNSSPSSTPKNVINFRNIQITKRIAATPTTSVNIINSVQQQKQISSKSSAIMTKSPQRPLITNMQPQIQRWSCSVNGVPSHQTPTTSAVTQMSQLPSQQTSTPVVKRT